MRIRWFNPRDIRHPIEGNIERTINEVGKRLDARGHEFHLTSVNPGNLLGNDIFDGIFYAEQMEIQGPISMLLC